MSAGFDIEPEQWKGGLFSTSQHTVGIPLSPLQFSTPGVGEVASFLDDVSKALASSCHSQRESSPAGSPFWLDKIYSFVVQGKPDEAIDILFEKVDDLLIEGRFERCNSLLRTIDLGRLDTHLVVAVLSITLSAAESLPYRPQLLTRARSRLMELAPDRIDRLLIGLG